jgi:hypothetical protein
MCDLSYCSCIALCCDLSYLKVQQYSKDAFVPQCARDRAVCVSSFAETMRCEYKIGAVGRGLAAPGSLFKVP